MEQNVEVVNVSRATDFLTGNTIFSVQFGVIGDVPPREFNTAPPAIGVVASIFVPFEKTAPYLVGSRWVLSVDDADGSISLRKSE